MDRRGFMSLSAVAASAAAHACGTTAAHRHAMPDQPSPPEHSVVAVVKTAAFATHRDAVREAVRLAGGLGFVAEGDRVLLKPALNSGNAYPATADPETVKIIGDMVLERGGTPFIADRTMFLKATTSVFKATGMDDVARALDAELVALESTRAVLAWHPLADHWFGNSVPVYEAVLEADHVINLCTPRTHAIGDLTMAVKNNVGVVDGRARGAMHGPGGFKERVAEIGLVARASLVVMDGRQGFSSGGPDDGDLVHPGFVWASTDALAMDAVGVAFLRMEGTTEALSTGSIWSIPILRRAAEVGLGATGPAHVEVLGLSMEDAAALRAVLV